MRTHFLGIDIGGTKFTLALADERGDIVKLVRKRTPAARGAPAIVDGIFRVVPQFIRLAKARGGAVQRIGVSFGGPVDYAKRRILLSHHVEGWADYPLCETLEKAFGLDVVIDNDCNVGALGEWKFGAGCGHRNLLYVNVGTGIGGGIIIDGKLLRGERNLAGEIGHVTVDPNGPVCTCGRRGCLESLASGPYIGLRAKAWKRDGRITAEQVFAAARRGERWAREIVAEAADALAFAIGAAVNLCNPSIVIIGGGVSEVGELLLRPLRRALPKYTLDLHRRRLKIVCAALGYDAGVRGAVALAMERAKT